MHARTHACMRTYSCECAFAHMHSHALPHSRTCALLHSRTHVCTHTLHLCKSTADSSMACALSGSATAATAANAATAATAASRVCLGCPVAAQKHGTSWSRWLLVHLLIRGRGAFASRHRRFTDMCRERSGGWGGLGWQILFAKRDSFVTLLVQ